VGIFHCLTYLSSAVVHLTGSVGGGCTQAATGGAEVVQGRRHHGAETAARGRWCGGLPAASAHPPDQLGFLWWAKGQ